MIGVKDLGLTAPHLQAQQGPALGSALESLLCLVQPLMLLLLLLTRGLALRGVPWQLSILCRADMRAWSSLPGLPANEVLLFLTLSPTSVIQTTQSSSANL